MSNKNFHLLRGDDQFSIKLHLEQLEKRMGADYDPAMNSNRMDAHGASLEDLQTAVATLPFFGSSRMVIIDLDPTKLDNNRRDKFLAILDSTPECTHLALVVIDHPRWKKAAGSWVRGWETLTDTHWLVKWFAANPAADITDLPSPDERSMQTWLVNEAKRQGGTIDPAAAMELARHTGTETGIASQEIAKLLMYVDFQRPIKREDVLALVSMEGSEDVFKMLDKLMSGNTSQAQAMLHRLLDDSPAEAIFGAFVYRFRQLLLVREALGEGENLQDLVKERVIFQKQVDEIARAARGYSIARLEELYRQLLAMDVAAKTSAIDLATQLEVFVIETAN